MQPVHGTALSINGVGVILTGASGAGKSDLALKLIDRGAKLIADDYVDVSVDGDTLVASPPAIIAGKMEIRGVGLVDMPHVADHPLGLIVCLVARNDVPRLPEAETRPIHGICLPFYRLHAFEASTPIKVETIARTLRPD